MISHVVASLDRHLLNTDVRTSPRRILSMAVTRIARVSGYLFLMLILGQLTWPQTSPGNSSAENADKTEKGAEFAPARELLKQGKYDQAIAELRQLSSSHPAMEGVSHELGVAYYKKSDYIAAAEQFRQALEKDPHDSEA